MDLPSRASRPSPGQRALAEALASGEIAASGEIRYLDVDRYLEPGRFAREQALLFGRLPLLVGPSSLLPEPRTAVTHDGYGIPLIISRDADGEVHALANVCRHRGTRLLEAPDAPVAASRISCPYHAWTYGGDGRLLSVPRPECFPGLDKQRESLASYPLFEAGGLIWIGLSPATSFADVAAVAADLDSFGMAPMHLYRRSQRRVAANWKLIIDAFLESYHVQRLHSGTIASFFADGIVAADCIGPHQRAVVGRTDYLAEVDRDDWSALRKAVTYTYQLFPNAVLIVSPDYINLLIAMPVGPGETIVEDQMLIPERPASPEAEAHWQRSWQLLDEGVFAAEDFHAAELNHRGLQSGLLDRIKLGTLEAGIATFHDRLDAVLAQPGSSA